MDEFLKNRFFSEIYQDYASKCKSEISAYRVTGDVIVESMRSIGSRGFVIYAKRNSLQVNMVIYLFSPYNFDFDSIAMRVSNAQGAETPIEMDLWKYNDYIYVVRSSTHQIHQAQNQLIAFSA